MYISFSKYGDFPIQSKRQGLNLTFGKLDKNVWVTEIAWSYWYLLVATKVILGGYRKNSFDHSSWVDGMPCVMAIGL